MLRTVGWTLGIVGLLLTQESALAARTCTREEIRQMIFGGSSMRQVEEACVNAREVFSRPLPEQSVGAPPPPPSAEASGLVSEVPQPPSETPVETTPTVETPPPEAVETATAPSAEPPAAPPNPFDDPEIVAVATPATLNTSNWRSQLPVVASESVVVEDQFLSEEPPAVELMTEPATEAKSVLTPLPAVDQPRLLDQPTAEEIASVQATTPEVPREAVGQTLYEAPLPTPQAPELLSVSNAPPRPANPPRSIPADGDIPAVDLSAVAPTPPPAAPSGTANGVLAGSCPETSLWWSGSPSSGMEFIDICSIQLDLGDLDRYYEFVPFTSLNAATDRRFDEDRNGISDKGTRVGNTIFWGGRDCSDGMVRIHRNQCDAVNKSGCAVVSVHLRAKPGLAPTTLNLRPKFYLLFPNGSRLPNDGKVQNLNYRGCPAG